MQFGIVAAVQPQILLFGNAPTTILHWLVPPLTVTQPQVYKQQLVVASCDEKTHEQWSHAPLFWPDRSGSILKIH